MIIVASIYKGVVGILARLQLHAGEVFQLILGVGVL